MRDHPSESSQNDRYDNLMTLFFRFFEADPTRFRVGDIVEVQITIAVVPIRNNKFKMICQLRSLALLDGTFTDVSSSSHIQPFSDIRLTKWLKSATLSRAKVASHPTASKRAIKRKVGYNQEDEEMNETRKRMVNMQMNNSVPAPQ